MSVIIFGLTHPLQITETISQEFEKRGHDVFRVSCDTDSPEYCGNFDYHIMSETAKKDQHKAMRIQSKGRPVLVKSIIEHFFPDPDFVFVIQSNIVLDFTGMKHIEIYYWQTQRLKPWWLKTDDENVYGLFYPYGMLGKLKNTHPIDVDSCCFTKMILPAWNSEYLKPSPVEYEDRPFKIGFKGSLSQEDGKRSDSYEIQHIYDERLKFVLHLSETEKDFLYRIPTNPESYIKFMNNTKIALNIPGTACYLNHRMYESMGMGVVLLQYRFEGIEQFGFKDYENCLLFKDINTLERKIYCIENNPNIIKGILLNSREFIEQNTFKHRAKEIVDTIFQNI